MGIEGRRRILRMCGGGNSTPPGPPGLSNDYSMLFDGSNEFVDCGNNYGFLSNTPYTLAAWFKCSSYAGYPHLFGKEALDGTYAGFQFGFLPTGAPYAYLGRDVGGGYTQWNTSTPVATNTWAFATFTYDGANNGWASGQIYIDGVPITTTGGRNNAGGILSAANTQPFCIGALPGQVFWAGNIDEPTVWNKALTSAEVTELYNGGVPLDPTTHSAAANLTSWWRMGDDPGDSISTIIDQVGSINGTPTNMEAGDIVADVP